MKNQELFDRTISILVKAYQQNTLEHGNCYVCAVGNLVAANMKIKFSFSKIWDSEKMPQWDDVFSTARGLQRREELNYIGEAKRQIDATGYTWEDLAQIEFAFETAEKGNNDDVWMFNGLMAVVDVLLQIHECEDVAEVTKSLFTKELTV